ncbi:hypothetical protein BGZ75_008408, partial [Mortierella antarctica]
MRGTVRFYSNGRPRQESTRPRATLLHSPEPHCYILPSHAPSTLNISIDSTPDQEATNLDKILGFYRTKWIMKKAWEAKKAQRSCIDLAIKGILRLAGGSEGRKREVGERRVIICIGLAGFHSQTGLPSKRSVMVRRLVER